MAQDELDAAEAGKNIGMAILSFISIITLIFYFFVKNALSVIRVRALTAGQDLIECSGFLQTTGGKSSRARQSEKSDGESFSRVSASCAGQRYEARTGGAESRAGDGHRD